jgi:hypothetical protein
VPALEVKVTAAPKKYERFTVYISRPIRRLMGKIAYDRDVKENEIYLEAIQEYLKRHGYANIESEDVST